VISAGRRRPGLEPGSGPGTGRWTQLAPVNRPTGYQEGLTQSRITQI